MSCWILTDVVGNLASIAGVGSAIAAATAVGLAPELFVIGLIGGGIQYMFLDTTRQKGASAVQRLEREATNLRNILLQLSGEAKSIVSVATERNS
jgi:hypothetical protein